MHWRIPQTIIIKQFDDASRNAFRQECDSFEKMGSIQGIGVIPFWYGKVKIDGSEKLAIAKEYLKGTPLHDLDTSHWRSEELCTGVERCFEKIYACGVIQRDVQPRRLDDLMLVTRRFQYFLSRALCLGPQ